MDVLHGFARIIGYILLVVGLPSFIIMFALFNSGLISSAVSQDISNSVSSLTGNAMLAGFLGFFVSIIGLFLFGAFAVFGAGLIFFGSKGYSGFSRVGTEILVLAVISLVSVYLVTGYVIPIIASSIGGSAAGAVRSTIPGLLSPVSSGIMVLDIIFIIVGAVLLSMKWIAPIVLEIVHRKTAKKNQKVPAGNVQPYRLIGIPVGIAVSLLIIAFFTLMNSSLLASNVITYNLTPTTQNAVSLAYQNASPNLASLENLSDYYFLTGPNETVTSSGMIGLSVSGIPVQISLPMSLAISKVGDPVRIDFNVSLSQFSSLISAINNDSGGVGKITVPNNLVYTLIYNDSGLLICNNLNASAGAPLRCTYQPIGENLIKVLLNVNAANENLSVLGLFFSLLEAPNTLLSANAGQNSTYAPSFTFKGNYKNYGNLGGDCSEFYVFAETSYTKTSGSICISDSTGLPTNVDLSETIKLNSRNIDLNINFITISVNQNVTVASVGQLAQGATIVNVG